MDANVNNGICISSPSPPRSSSSPLLTRNLTCRMLLKNQCNRYVDFDKSHIEGELIVIDAPCFFNGYDDNSELQCIEKSSINSESCESIKTNSIIIYEGEERESCNEAHIIFGWSFICGWVNGYIKNTGYCGHTYYLTESSF
jgi:hypothetical protein